MAVAAVAQQRIVQLVAMVGMVGCFWLHCATAAGANSTGPDQTPRWRLEQSLQRAHAPQNVSDVQLAALCQMNDAGRIDALLDNILVPRTVGSQNHKKVALYIRFTLEKLNYRVEFFTFSRKTVNGWKNFTNIVATRHAHAPRRLALACHYDSKDFGQSGPVFLGATDSALPCALLIDIAASLNDSMPAEPRRDLTLQLIFFDGEEAFRYWSQDDSLYGSTYLADLWSEQLYDGTLRQIDRIDLLVVLDLLGSADTTISNYASVNQLAAYRLLVDTEKRLRHVARCLDASTAANPLFRDEDVYFRMEDDHLPFFRKGVGVLHVISWPFPTVWHTEADDRSALSKPVVANLAAVLRAFTARYLRIYTMNDD